MAILVDTMESKTIINALLRFGKLNQGTNLIEINQLVDDSNGLLKLQEVTDALVDGQFRNYVE